MLGARSQGDMAVIHHREDCDMAGSGEIYKRKDGNWAFRVKASNGQVVATDGGQGYSSKASAVSTLTNLLAGEYNGEIKELD